MASHPNFPEFLDIAPSRTPNDLPAQLQDTFGSRAQEDAIRVYGIAGRVWYDGSARVSRISTTAGKQPMLCRCTSSQRRILNLIHPLSRPSIARRSL